MMEDRQAALTALCERLRPELTGATPAQAAGTRHGPNGEAVGSLATMGAAERCRRYLATLPDAVSGKNGSGRTFHAACECFKFGLSDAEAWEVLGWYNQTKCKPVWSEGELRHKLDDARREVERTGEVGRHLREGRGARGKPVVGGKRPWQNPLPEWIRNLKRPTLRPFQRLILQTIADRCDGKPIDGYGSLGYAIVSHEELADSTLMCVRSCKSHVLTLATMGVLVVRKGGRVRGTGKPAANVYAVPGQHGALAELAMRWEGEVARHGPSRFDKTVHGLHPVPPPPLAYTGTRHDLHSGTRDGPAATDPPAGERRGRVSTQQANPPQDKGRLALDTKPSKE